MYHANSPKRMSSPCGSTLSPISLSPHPASPKFQVRGIWGRCTKHRKVTAKSPSPSLPQIRRFNCSIRDPNFHCRIWGTCTRAERVVDVRRTEGATHTPINPLHLGVGPFPPPLVFHINFLNSSQKCLNSQFESATLSLDKYCLAKRDLIPRPKPKHFNYGLEKQ